MSGPNGSRAEHFHAIVVGSGFGGSVTACRLAEAGRSVLVLERGKAYPPGSFPRSPLGFSKNLWDPSAGLHGMFNLWEFSGLDAVISSGLGGGSLIYANVMLRKDEHWFVNDDHTNGAYESWPVTRADLDPHYDRAEQMLGATTYPTDFEPYASTPKVKAFHDAAQAVGAEARLAPVAVTFASEPGAQPIPGEPIVEARENIHKRTRQTCRLVGECDIGCNYGSKNSLDFTYLTAAWHAGADIRTRSEVRSFEPREGGGWSVGYVEHTPASEGHPTDTQALPVVRVTADHLVLSAGTLGTPFLLMRNRAALPALSTCLGQGFSGNGDLLTLAVRSTEMGPDGRRTPRVVDAPNGPVITSYIRGGDALDGDGSIGRGFYLEDAGYPQFASWMLELLDEPHALLRAAPIVAGLAEHLLRRRGSSDISAQASRLLGDCALASGLLPLLGMGRDVPDGKMSLDGDGRLDVDWSKQRGSRAYFARLNSFSQQMAEALGGEFLDNPMWLLNRVITVHPLGGARMGRSADEGVCDPYGRVFNYPGLHIADGSVMPGPVGANPSLTIAALADRFADALLEGVPEPVRRPVARTIPDDGAPAEVAQPSSEDPVSVAFTEQMKGYCAFDETDYDRGFRSGKQAGQRLDFELTITADDIDRFVADRDHQAQAAGWIESAVLGGRRPVTHGQFNLFVDQDGDTSAKRMYYRLFFDDAAEHPLTLVGFKDVRDDRGMDLWTDTTTLFARVLQGHVAASDEASATIVASGILRIHPLDFARQLTTFRVEPARHVEALGRFGELFAGELWQVYGRRRTR